MVKRTFKPRLKVVENLEAAVVLVTIEETKPLMVGQQVESTVYTTPTQVTIVNIFVSTATR